jgi:hypothetical protein
MNKELRKALGLALQILEDLPGQLRPENNIKDMHEILAGRSSGRDDIIVQEAVATALAWRTHDAVLHPLNPDDKEAFASGFNNRAAEFADLFTAVSILGPNSVGMLFVQACNRIARLQDQ